MRSISKPRFLLQCWARSVVSVFIMASALAACSSTPLLKDAPPTLQPDQGILAVVVDDRHPLDQLRLIRNQHALTTINIPSAQNGKSLYLIAVEAGSYCVKGFTYKAAPFDAQRSDVDCFIVQPGHIAYSGSLIPVIAPGYKHGMWLLQNFEPAAMLVLLYRDYPAIAARIPVEGLGLPAAHGAGALPDDRSHVMGTWHEAIKGTQAEAIHFRDNASWKLELTELRLTRCHNIKEACGVVHPQLVLSPGQEVKSMVVHAADPSKPFSYDYRYSYHVVPKRFPLAVYHQRGWTTLSSFTKGIRDPKSKPVCAGSYCDSLP